MNSFCITANFKTVLQLLAYYSACVFDIDNNIRLIISMVFDTNNFLTPRAIVTSV